MSALTKVFVVLHVVLSMLLTAGLIVFVNRSEDFRTKDTALQNKLDIAVKDTALADAELQRARTDLLDKLNATTNELENARHANDDAQSTINGLNTKVADLTSQAALSAAAQTTTADALKVAQTQNQTMQGNFAQLRQSQDALQKQYIEASLQITDLQNKLDVTERQRRYLAEQVTQLTSENSRQADLIHKNIPAIEDRNGAILNATPTIALDGVVRDKTIIAGVPYATISIGSADAVQKNMQFKVIDGDQFLGYLTVDSVEPHEATGRLEGPHVDAVHQGVEVKTQL